VDAYICIACLRQGFLMKPIGKWLKNKSIPWHRAHGDAEVLHAERNLDLALRVRRAHAGRVRLQATPRALEADPCRVRCIVRRSARHWALRRRSRPVQCCSRPCSTMFSSSLLPSCSHASRMFVSTCSSLKSVLMQPVVHVGLGSVISYIPPLLLSASGRGFAFAK
jgi:hypothetical protein